MEKENNRIPLYVRNDFLKFDRKMYSFLGLNIGRPIPLKGVLYFFIIGIIEIIWYITPIISHLIRWIPVGILVSIPILFAWLLTDVGTEGRSPISFFRSLIHYHYRKIKKVTYYQEKEIMKERKYSFHSHFTYGLNKKIFKRKKYRYKGFLTYR